MGVEAEYNNLILQRDLNNLWSDVCFVAINYKHNRSLCWYGLQKNLVQPP